MALDKQAEQCFTLHGHAGGTRYAYCANHRHQTCNWLVPAGGDQPLCRVCVLNRTIPRLSEPGHITRWQTLKYAKHRLMLRLLQLGLPLVSKTENEETGLAFDFLADAQKPGNEKVLTSHDNGLMTINISEANDVEREMARKNMEEVYRTVLGHFSHEVGHYYWNRLIDNTLHLAEFRQLFGDEQADYAEALKQHYAHGPPADWNQQFISAYATTHPWEDRAETWALPAHR